LAKCPVYFLHVWLPKAHVEAPTSARILLAGVLLKVGVFGVFRFAVVLNRVNFRVVLIRLVGILIAPISALFSVETKVIRAYRRVSHMNLILYGINIMSNIRMGGSYLISLSHGFISSLIFSLVGIIYNTNRVRIIYFSLNLMNASMFIGILVYSLFLGNAGTPPLISFWGELFLILSVITLSPVVSLMFIPYFIYSFYYSVYIIIRLTKLGLLSRYSKLLSRSLFRGFLFIFNLLLFL